MAAGEGCNSMAAISCMPDLRKPTAMANKMPVINIIFAVSTNFFLEKRLAKPESGLSREKSGIKGFSKILSVVEENAPLRRNVTIDDVGNVAAFLLSDLASGVTAEITYVDGGFSKVMGGGADAA